MQENVYLKFIESDAYDQLEIWFDFTGWKLNDFANLISLIDVDLPIEINEYSNEQFICKDSKNNDFIMKIDYNYDKDSSTISIEFKDESFTLYEVPNRVLKYQSINIFPIETTIKNSLNTKIYKRTITKDLTIGTKTLYKIYIVCGNNNILKKVILNSKNLDNYLLTMHSGFSTMYFMPILIDNLNLTDKELEKMDITVSLIETAEDNTIYSKTRLKKNVITEARFFTSTGFLDIYENGKFIFTSKNKNISLIIDNLTNLEDEDFEFLVGYNKESILKLLNSMKIKKWLDTIDI